ncbi:hypothetical protein PV726_49145, partial [Streptomyces europaeiscabiei]|uniref:hypothetical protein n=1 Tax=Streptomyces europaeiscabiei TaxID=146819 RepID=UPI0029AB9356
MLLDADGDPVELPRVTTLTVPIRWLRPVETPVSPSHHDAAFRGFYCKTGKLGLLWLVGWVDMGTEPGADCECRGHGPRG